jgi:DNA polymerase iota
VDYNLKLLNAKDLSNSFLCLSKDDPTVGFAFDASKPVGHVYDEYYGSHDASQDELRQRLILGSHLANRMRLELEERKGYTSTVGISTSKLLSKLVGNVNKPHDQTTLLPPYTSHDTEPSNVTTFIDGHDVGKIPNIGFKMAHKLREYALQHNTMPLVDSGVKEERHFTVHDVRTLPGMSPTLLEKVLSGPGMQQGVGTKTWNLLHGVDDTEVDQARELPRQISIEDSFGRLDTLIEVQRQLVILSISLINRMRIDLTEDEYEEQDLTSRLADSETSHVSSRMRWLAHPKVLRLSTRPRSGPRLDGGRAHFANRVSRSAPVPSFLYNLSESVDILADRLVSECLLPLFRRLHPEKTGWDLSLLNIAVTNLVETAGSSKQATGRDIGKMFKNQEHHLRAWKVEDRDVPPDQRSTSDDNDTFMFDAGTRNVGNMHTGVGSEDILPLSQSSQISRFQGGWEDDEEGEDSDQPLSSTCPLCRSEMPYFAMPAHLRFHEAEG